MRVRIRTRGPTIARIADLSTAVPRRQQICCWRLSWVKRGDVPGAAQQRTRSRAFLADSPAPPRPRPTRRTPPLRRHVVHGRAGAREQGRQRRRGVRAGIATRQHTQSPAISIRRFSRRVRRPRVTPAIGGSSRASRTRLSLRGP